MKFDFNLKVARQNNIANILKILLLLNE